MKKISSLKWILIFSVFVSVLIFMIYPRHFIKDEVGNVTTFSNNSEVFVFVKISHYGYVGSYLKAYWTALTESMPSGSLQTLREDTIIIHYEGGQQLEKTVIRDFSIYGEVVWFEGALYSEKGPPPRMLWRWTGTTFEQLHGTEASDIQEKMKAKFRYYEDQNKLEGWKQNALANSFQGDEMSYRFDLSGNKLKLKIEKVGDSANQIVIVSHQINDSSVEELVKINSSWKNVTKEDYFSELGEITQRN